MIADPDEEVHKEESVAACKALVHQRTAHATHGLSCRLVFRAISARPASCGTRIRVSARSWRERSRGCRHFRGRGKLPVRRNRWLPLYAVLRPYRHRRSVCHECSFDRDFHGRLTIPTLIAGRSTHHTAVHRDATLREFDRDRGINPCPLASVPFDRIKRSVVSVLVRRSARHCYNFNGSQRSTRRRGTPRSSREPINTDTKRSRHRAPPP